MWLMLVSNLVWKLNMPSTTVSTATTHTTTGLLSSDTLPKRLRMALCGAWRLTVVTCGRYISTNTMVPMSRNEAKMPRSRRATDCSGTRARNEPTVVMLPTKIGVTISRRALRLQGVCCRWAMKCNG